ncbi:MAG: glutamine synthetase adenylyltransferase [Anaerolineae bacterium]
MNSGHRPHHQALREQLSDDEAASLLTPVGFTDRPAAHHSLRRIAVDPEVQPALAECLPHLLTALSNAASPDRVLVNFERFTRSVIDAPTLFRYLAGNPRAVEMLVTLFAGSQFLTEILLRNPEYFERLMERKGLAQSKSVEQLCAEAEAVAAPFAAPDGQLDALRRFQRWELLRIGACGFFSLWDMPAATMQLSHLADSLVHICLTIAARQLGTGTDGFAVIALGKLGGEELNYSSDIDLLFIASSNVSAHQRLGQRLIDTLARVTAEGFLYRVDMRLRPWGRTGALVSSLDGHINYLREHARLWEKQALLKARGIAGHAATAAEFLRQAEPLIFEEKAEAVRKNVQEMKQRTEAHLRRHGRDWGEVKLGAGSIRDVEFVTQYLQLAHGAAHPEIHRRKTLDALAQLFTAGFLSMDEYRVLADGYTFLRTVEHHLQLMHYRQTSRLPDDNMELTHFARRLGFQGNDAGAQFLARYQQHCQAIRTVYNWHLGSNNVETSADPQTQARGIRRHVARMDPSYATTFSDVEIKRHAELVARLDHHNLVEVDAMPLGDGSWRITVVGYDYLGELSLICGLLFVYGFSILDGHVFTYEPPAYNPPAKPHHRRRSRIRRRQTLRTMDQPSQRKIVDVLTVQSVQGESPEDVWSRYRDDLSALLRRLQQGNQRKAQGELAKRVAITLRETADAAMTLYPIDVEIDNTASDRYTVLHIGAPDTVGFLYEFTNALALNGVHIALVTIDSVEGHVHDMLYVTDAHGRKITAPDKERELRAAAVLVKHFTHLLPRSPNPESALIHFREFLGQLFMRPDWPDELASLEHPEVLGALARLLGVSDFLWDDFLRMQHANLFPVVRDVDTLATAKSYDQLQTELSAALQAVTDSAASRDTLNAFKDREMFRIDMRHILGHTTEFGQFSEELTELTEVVIHAAYRLCNEELRAEFGVPCLEDGSPSPLSVCALGKFGGRELGFASDIELMFVYAGNGETSGPRVITTAEYFEKLVQEILSAIRAKREGIFEVDLRLRPYGSAGSMAVSLAAFRRYFAPDGPAWDYERQALVKLRPVAGELAFGEQVVVARDACVYSGQPFDVAAMRAMRERQMRHLVMGGTINAKYSPGGLVDAEYIVQGLQITHGPQDHNLRLTNTPDAIAALAAAGILPQDDFTRLHQAYAFLRQLIDALRMVRGNAKDLTVPPADSEEFAFLARRLGYGSDVAQLQDDLTRHTTQVQELSVRLLG